MASNKHAGRVKRFFGIDPDQTLRDSALYDDGSYVEEEPSVKEALFELIPTLPGTLQYLKELFPFLGWIFHYNLTWLLGDFIAGECSVNARNLEILVKPNIRRCHGWLRRRAPGHGLCPPGQSTTRIWPLHVLRRLPAVLGIRDV